MSLFFFNYFKHTPLTRKEASKETTILKPAEHQSAWLLVNIYLYTGYMGKMNKKGNKWMPGPPRLKWPRETTFLSRITQNHKIHSVRAPCLAKRQTGERWVKWKCQRPLPSFYCLKVRRVEYGGQSKVCIRTHVSNDVKEWLDQVVCSSCLCSLVLDAISGPNTEE